MKKNGVYRGKAPKSSFSYYCVLLQTITALYSGFKIIVDIDKNHGRWHYFFSRLLYQKNPWYSGTLVIFFHAASNPNIFITFSN